MGWSVPNVRAGGQRRAPVTPIAQSFAPSQVTGTTVETVLAQIIFPSGFFKPRSTILIETFWSTSGAGSVTPKLYVGYEGDFAGSTLFAGNVGDATVAGAQVFTAFLCVRANGQILFGEVPSQRGLGALNPTRSAPITRDLGREMAIFVTALPSATTKVVTLEGYALRMLRA